MKSHIVFWLRPDVRHTEVGSWLDAIADPSRAGPPFQPDVDLVLLQRPGGFLIAHEHDPASTGGWSADERVLGLDRKFRAVSRSDGPIAGKLVENLRGVPVVERVEPGLLANAPLAVASSMSAQPSGWAGEAIGLADAHVFTRGARGVVIAVLDTGVDLAHGEYAHRLAAGFDFVDIIDGADSFLGDRLEADADPTDPGVGHGSHVTGILVARGDRMSAGVAPACTVLPVRVLGALRQGDRVIGAGLVDNINAGIKWAVDHGADVINMSLGIRHEGGGLPHTDVIRYAERRGVAVVAAAGNDGRDTLYYPGALPGVLAVGAVDRGDHVAAYSTWGAQVDLVAPGSEIWSGWLDGGYAFATGTSQATPFVAGAAALCQAVAAQHGRRLTPSQVAAVLTATADRPDQHFRTPLAGSGRLNCPDALQLVSHRLDRSHHSHSPGPGPVSRRELVPA